MINIDHFRSTYNFILKANTRGRNTSKEFNEAVNYASRTVFMKFYGNQQDYMNGRQVPRIAYEETQRMSDALKPFKSDPITIDKVNGVFPTPKDNQHISTVSFNDISIKRFSQAEIGTVLKSSIIAPTNEYPAYVEYNGYVKVYPSTIEKIEMVCLKKPKEVKWGYTLDANGREVYSPSLSIDLEWNDDMYNQLMAVTLQITGLTLKDSELAQYFNIKENTGQ